MEKLLEITKELCDLNKDLSITGTLMLKLRGIDLGREPHDIDLLIPTGTTLILPKTAVKTKSDYGDGSEKYEYNGFKIDILSSEEKPEIINGWKLGSIEQLMGAKFKYTKQGNKSSNKHYDDLVKLNYKFPDDHQSTICLDLPFTQ